MKLAIQYNNLERFNAKLSEEIQDEILTDRFKLLSLVTKNEITIDNTFTADNPLLIYSLELNINKYRDILIGEFAPLQVLSNTDLCELLQALVDYQDFEDTEEIIEKYVKKLNIPFLKFNIS